VLDRAEAEGASTDAVADRMAAELIAAAPQRLAA
jgi:hypothetical protein